MQNDPELAREQSQTPKQKAVNQSIKNSTENDTETVPATEKNETISADTNKTETLEEPTVNRTSSENSTEKAESGSKNVTNVPEEVSESKPKSSGGKKTISLKPFSQNKKSLLKKSKSSGNKVKDAEQE